MNGRDLAKNLLSLRPGLERLFVSGYPANVIAHHGVLDEGVHFFQKPFSIEALAAKVQEALDTNRSRSDLLDHVLELRQTPSAPPTFSLSIASSWRWGGWHR